MSGKTYPKPEHIIKREHAAIYPEELGINMAIPEHLYNLGEIYNLSISRGTLTEEDRFKINEHMISTIKMLESLPFPEELKNVPRYASTHHETMKGSGYPRKLPGAQLARYVLVDARDGYRVLYSLAELDPGTGKRRVLLVDRCNGAALGQEDGPLRLIAPEDARPARWVRQVKSITVVTAP